MNSKVILHKTKVDYVCEFIIDETCTPGTSSFETIIVLDRSGSMCSNTDKLINRVFPKVFKRLNYKDSDIIHLITFDSVTEHIRLAVRDFPKHPVHSRGGTEMQQVIPKLEAIFNSSKKKFRILTVTDGDVWDQEETVNAATKLAQKIKGLYAINSQAIRLFTSGSEPDTRAVSSLLQLHTLKKVNLENVDANLSDDEIAEIIIRMFLIDSFEYDFLLQASNNCIREDLWSQKRNQMILTLGKNIFWIDNPEEFTILINGSSQKVRSVNGVDINRDSYQKILQDKINKYIQKIKVLSVVNNAETQNEINQIISDVENYEKKILVSVPQDSIASKMKRFANVQNLNSLSNDEKAKIIQSDEGLDEDNYLDPRYTKIDPIDFYDVIIDSKMFEDLSDPNIGWQISKSEEAKQNYKELTKTSQPVIGVVGTGNKGKSYILSRISGYTLPDGYSVVTQGISVKYYKESENKNFVLLDSAGCSTPLIETNQFSLNDDIEDEEKARKQIQSIQRDKCIMELFLQRFIIKYSNIILAVVGQMTYEEQKLLKRLKKIAGKKQLIIIHNLLNFTRIEQVQSYIDKVLKNIITFNLKEQTYVSFNEGGLSDSQNKKYFTEQLKGGGHCVHIILASDLKTSETKAYYNESGLNYLQYLLVSNTQGKKFDPIENIKKHLKECSVDFMNNIIEQENIVYKDEKIYVEGTEIKLKSIMYSEMGDSNFFGNVYEPNYSVWLQDPQNENTVKYIEYKNKKDILDKWKQKNDKIKLITEKLEKEEAALCKDKKHKKLSTEQISKLISKLDGSLDFKMAGDMKTELAEKEEKKDYKELVIELEVAGEKPSDLKTKYSAIDSMVVLHAKGTKVISEMKGECLSEHKLKHEKFDCKVKIPCQGELFKDQEDIVFQHSSKSGAPKYTGVIRISIPYSNQEVVEEEFDDL